MQRYKPIFSKEVVRCDKQNVGTCDLCSYFHKLSTTEKCMAPRKPEEQKKEGLLAKVKQEIVNLLNNNDTEIETSTLIKLLEIEKEDTEWMGTRISSDLPKKKPDCGCGAKVFEKGSCTYCG